MSTRPFVRGAFSLVEVVLALGILSFSIISMLGLCSVGMNASQQSGEKTALTAMALQVISAMRAQPAGSTQFFFDVRGNPAEASAAHYECVVTRQPITNGPVTNGALSMAKLTFSWPASMPAGARANSDIVYATLPQ